MTNLDLQRAEQAEHLAQVAFDRSDEQRCQALAHHKACEIALQKARGAVHALMRTAPKKG